MKYSTQNWLIIAGIMIGIIFEISILYFIASGQLYYYPTHPSQLSEKDSDNYTITGIYFPQGVICIRTEGRTDEQINNTISHEWAHYLIGKNKTCGNEGCYEHFCE